MLYGTAHGTPLYPVQIYRDRLCGVYVGLGVFVMLDGTAQLLVPIFLPSPFESIFVGHHPFV